MTTPLMLRPIFSLCLHLWFISMCLIFLLFSVCFLIEHNSGRSIYYMILFLTQWACLIGCRRSIQSFRRYHLRLQEAEDRLTSFMESL